MSCSSRLSTNLSRRFGWRRFTGEPGRVSTRRSDSSLALTYLEDLCFDARQAAEKAVKAVFIHRQLRFPYVHDFADLLDLLEKGGVKIPKYVLRADDLTRYAVELRYPGLSGPVTKRQHRRAVRIAESIVRRAERQIPKP